ncbi:DNA repair protein RadA [Candidatus Daviesbacteria bacterium]|nr:DNA repair protein RadA [Candidatus Daviesbacteria bacterium]
MAKTTSVYICQQCGYQSPNFLGRCPECGTWNSLVEQVSILSKARSVSKDHFSISDAIGKLTYLSDIEKKYYDRLSTKIGEFDRVLGGGIVLGSLILVAGDPGIGKSTLLSQLALNIDKSLYVAGEESAQQIKHRVERLKKGANLAILNEVDVDVIGGVIETVKPPLVIIDSIQTLQTDELESVAGSVGQVRESTHRLQRLAKKIHTPIFLVGHVTKEGTVAGPKTLEHLVDVVLSLEGDPTSQFRILRASKNRFGPTDEVGIFDMSESGMVEVKNPSKVFLDQKIDAPGSAVLATINGLRPILLEIQALVTKSNLAVPRRVSTGVDINRLQLLVAVLQKRLGLPLYSADIFVNVTGGIRVSEPAADLGICMAIISSFQDQILDAKTVFIGEVGLLGELRTVRNLEKRVTEAKKLGYINVISSENAKSLNEIIKRLKINPS